MHLLGRVFHFSEQAHRMVALAGSKWRLLVVMIATGCCHKKSNRDGHRWHPALSIAARIPQEIVLLGAPPIGDGF